MSKVIVIAEFGSNSVEYGWNFERFCFAAKQAGATHCKVQIFQASHFPHSERASKKPLEFPRDKLREFRETAHEYNLLAGASVFDKDAAILVGRSLDFIKLAAREQLNDTLLHDCIVRADHKPIYRSVNNLKYIIQSKKFTNLFTVSEYPTPLWKALFNVVRTAQYMRGLEWGWSSHTVGYQDCVLAVKLGAKVIEKHIALSKDDLETGHSLLPQDFKKMCEAING